MKVLFYFFVFLNSAYAKATDSSQMVLIDLSKQDTSVEFLATGKPTLIKIKGTGAVVTGNVSSDGPQISGQFNVALNTLTTGINLRDEHMKKKYLETEKFPVATLKISKLVFDRNYLKVNGEQKNVPFSGKLLLHGVENEIEGMAQIVSDAQRVAVEAKMVTVLTNYKINIPTYLGIKVADEVEISVSLKIKK